MPAANSTGIAIKQRQNFRIGSAPAAAETSAFEECLERRQMYNQASLADDRKAKVSPGADDMRWYQVLTSDTQVTGERQQP
jgi:hypothetical protein